MTMRAPETELLGGILAGLTHEMRNVLAIVGETAGLIEDLLDARGSKGEKTEEKLRRAVAGIRKQVVRGTDLSGGLSQFAHTFDGPDASLPPNTLAGLVVFLMRRSARSRQVALALRENPAATAVWPTPSRFLLASCTCVGVLLEEAPAGSCLQIQPVDAAGSAALRVIWTDPGPAPSEVSAVPPAWGAVLDEIGCALETLADDEGRGVRISAARHA